MNKQAVMLTRLALGIVAVLLTAAILFVLASREEGEMAARGAGLMGRGIAHGASIYGEACAGCHGIAGLGVPEVAPALNSAAFFSERLAELGYQGSLRSYVEGALASGRPVGSGDWSAVMPAWATAYGGPLRPDEIRDLASFVLNWDPALSPAASMPPYPAPPSIEGAPPGEIGKALYAVKACLGCHGWPGRGGVTAPDLAGIATYGAAQVPGQTAEDYIRVSLLAPSAVLAADCPPGPCPDMMPRDYGSTLAQEEIEYLVQYMLTLVEDPYATDRPARTLPALSAATLTPLGPADSEEGRLLYEEHCAQCHGDRGQGGMGTALSAVLISVDPLRYARASVAHGMPGTMMPAWAESHGGPLADTELDSVAARVVELGRSTTMK